MYTNIRTHIYTSFFSLSFSLSLLLSLSPVLFLPHSLSHIHTHTPGINAQHPAIWACAFVRAPLSFGDRTQRTQALYANYPHVNHFVLQYVAVWCYLCVAVCCCLLQCLFPRNRKQRTNTLYGNYPMWILLCCSVLQCVAVCCSVCFPITERKGLTRSIQTAPIRILLCSSVL